MADWPAGAPTSLGGRYAQLVAITIATELDRRQWSQRELARRAGVSHVTIANITSGRNWPDIETLARIEDALERVLLPADRLHRT
ncbi:helix-turn-helix transcriptional regulator [Cellulomonas biazotea]|uniref:helix-turn-helix transcriptional regulator n=1 Tax=Cellulomonas biazotea TaxID=1709 RepID=UPI0013EF1A80|nr:helix-turn-helix transcriptional regulator [Cellulomonas biazotea]